MTQPKIAVLILMFLLPAVCAHAEEPPPAGGRAEIDGFKAYQQEEQAFRQAHAAKMLEVETEAAKLKMEMLKAPDEAAKQAVWDKLKPLREQKFALLEEKAVHDLEAAQKFVGFAQKRVEMAEKYLAEVRAKKSETIDAPPEGISS